ncbi:hypothetical protein [Mycobacterium sp. SA01]|uniref:hypothetical protein n=1 Tax=Mycobacterium sp. SA01 TaxID=3238820 RepID=UPI00351B694A
MKYEILNVDGSINSPKLLRSPSAQTKKRKRWDVTGGHGLQFNDHGVFYRGTNRVPPRGMYGHLIHPGKNYAGPVLPAYGSLTGRYLADPDDDRDDPAAERITCYERRAAELIAFEVLGPPPAAWSATAVLHLDGDPANCAPGNLRYAVDAERANILHDRDIRSLMVSEVTASRLYNEHSAFRFAPYHGRRKPKEALMGERLDVTYRHRMVHKPHVTVENWDGLYGQRAS